MAIFDSKSIPPRLQQWLPIITKTSKIHAVYFFYIKNDSKLADQNFLKHKSDKKYFFLRKYNTYCFILNSGQ